MDEEPLPNHLRCNRSDGRQWRCKRRVKENMKLCEIHYLQGRHRQFKEKVPESLKIMRKRKPINNSNSNSRDRSVKIRVEKVENIARLVKRKRKKKKKNNNNNYKNGADAQLELIRMVLKREVEKRKRNNEEEEEEEESKNKNKKKKKKKNEEEDKDEVEKNKNREGELMRYLPNGLMAISSTSPSSSPRQHSGNVGSESPYRVKVGVDFGAPMYRQFRSKNIEPVPIGALQVLPYARNVAELRRAKKKKKKKCHWCQRSDSRVLINCSSCEKHFFCLDCIGERFVLFSSTLVDLFMNF